MVYLKQVALAASLFLLNFPGQVLATQTGRSGSDVAYDKRDIDSDALLAALEARGIDPRDLEAREPFFQLIGLAAKGIGKAVKAGVNSRKKKSKKAAPKRRPKKAAPKRRPNKGRGKRGKRGYRA